MTEYPVHITDTPIFTNIFINVIPHPALTLDSIRSLSHTVYMLISTISDVYRNLRNSYIQNFTLRFKPGHDTFDRASDTMSFTRHHLTV